MTVTPGCTARDSQLVIRMSMVAELMLLVGGVPEGVAGSVDSCRALVTVGPGEMHTGCLKAVEKTPCSACALSWLKVMLLGAVPAAA